ncbi:MAG: hypothetical protein HY075_14520 [Deltaproteobacteria bacterium]|nr:hypothetical protein [Deltaproteobacteria bacterium]
MKKFNDLASLSLLDDDSSTNLPERAWDDLTIKAMRAEAAPKVVQPTKAAAAPAPRQAPAARVFSSKPTLRQMMSEYNKRSARIAPIKTYDPAADPATFRFESVDLIQIPIIPGKILRPARDSDADA